MITKQTIFNEAQRQKQMQEQEKIILYDAVLEVLADANLLGNPQHEGKLAPELVQELIDTARGWEKTAGMYRRLATQRVEAVKGASRSPIIARSNRVPIRPIADNSGGRFSAEHEINELKQVIRQLTDYVNELRRDVDTLQGYGD